MKDLWPFDLQLFSAGLEEDDTAFEDDETPDAETPATPETTLTPEQENERLRATVAAQGTELNAFRGVIEELQRRPTERIIERERQPDRQVTQEDEDRQNANLAIELGTNPKKILEQVTREATVRAQRAMLAETGGVAADAIIDRFERKFKEENPLVGDKVAAIFRKTLDAMGDDVKANLVLMPQAKREEVMRLHWNASGGEYLLSKVKPRVRSTASTDTGGRSAAETPARRAAKGFSYTDEQKSAMRRAGMSDEKIAADEKKIQDGLR